MVSTEQSEKIKNRILLSLPTETYNRLRDHLQFVQLHRGDVLTEIDAPVENIYFVNRGLVSIVKPMRDGRVVEVGGIGIEGVTDPTALFGVNRAALDAIVQIPGSAIRVKRSVFVEEMNRYPALCRFMQAYTRFAIRQLAQTAACNRLHTLDQRSCRWLLLAGDNAMSNTFEMTHEFLAMMLGVQRPGVSIALGTLKRAGLIEYAHGRIKIMDRKGLEREACECHQATQDELKLLFGSD